MMRGFSHYAVAMRLPRTQEIRIDRGELRSSRFTSRIWKLPLLSGLALLLKQMHLGMKSLMWSAGVNAGDQDIEIGKREIGISIAVALAFSLLLFIGLPLLGAGGAVR